MTEPARVTAADIARLAGVGRAAVSNWRRRHDDFPAPVAGTPNSPVFALAEVEAWLRAAGKLREVDPEDRLWHQLDATRGDRPLAAAIAQVGVYLRYLQQGHEPPTPARLSGPFTALAAELPGDPPAPPDPARRPLLRTVAELAAGRPAVDVFEMLVTRYRAAASRQVTATPPQLAALMNALAGGGDTVLDPACGLGGILGAASDDRHTLTGQEADDGLANLAWLRLALAGTPATVRVGDSLTDDAFDDGCADAVVCDPPFNERTWNPDEFAYDARFEYGLPPRAEPELAWVQHCLAKACIGGHAVVLMPATAGSRPSGRRVRAELLRRGALRAVFGLPANALSYKAIPMQLWVLRRPDGTPVEGHVLLVDTDGHDWRHIRDTILGAWSSFTADPTSVDVPGTARSVPLIDLLDDEVDLTPTRRLGGAESAGARETLAAIERVAKLLDSLPGRLPPLSARPAAPLTMTTIGELARLGKLQILGAPSRRGRHGDSGTDPVLTAEDLQHGRVPSGRAQATDDWPRTALGDVVLPTTARTPRPTVVTDGGALLGARLVALRCDAETLDPWFVAGFLHSPDNARRASSLGSTHRIDVRRARLPRLPLADQRRYGRVFRHLAALHADLTRAASELATLHDTIATALAAGILDPAD